MLFPTRSITVLFCFRANKSLSLCLTMLLVSGHVSRGLASENSERARGYLATRALSCLPTAFPFPTSTWPGPLCLKIEHVVP